MSPPTHFRIRDALGHQSQYIRINLTIQEEKLIF